MTKFLDGTVLTYECANSPSELVLRRKAMGLWLVSGLLTSHDSSQIINGLMFGNPIKANWNLIHVRSTIESDSIFRPHRIQQD
jgi:hypothetical protein